MPSITNFYGITIKMYFQRKEHNPPHIHAVYGDCMGAIDIQTLKMIEGDLPNKALNLVIEWVEQHQSDLMEIWNTQQFIKLPPLV